MMNFIDLLGKTFSEKDGSFTHTTLEGDEGHGVYTHHIEENNGLWQMNLDANGVVQTIFLPAKPGNVLPFGLEASMRPSDVQELLGLRKKWGKSKRSSFLAPTVLGCASIERICVYTWSSIQVPIYLSRRLSCSLRWRHEFV